MEKRKIVRRIILAVLLVCAVFLIYSIVTDPLGEHDIMLALAVTAGFIALEQDKRKEREISACIIGSWRCKINLNFDRKKDCYEAYQYQKIHMDNLHYRMFACSCEHIFLTEYYSSTFCKWDCG